MTEPTNLGTIGAFSLHNGGLFDCKGGASVAEDDGSFRDVGYTGLMIEGMTQTYGPGQFGVSDGSVVLIFVDIVAGHDKRGEQCFTFDSGSPVTAYYSVSGETFASHLIFDHLG